MIEERVGSVAYRLQLPDALAGIHPTFHVSHLRKCLADATEHVPLDDIVVDDKLNYVEEPVAKLDKKEKRLRRKVIHIVKVQWKHRKGSEATWEPKADMRESYPHLFPDDTGFDDENSLRGEDLYHPSFSFRKRVCNSCK
ncbi:hypothetical protein L1987_87496 [Smallanthus sonchifolius]|nr:hypothetical protein L1987_87496 [Smallanthus sonchifolius]